MQMPAFLTRFTMKQQLVEPEKAPQAVSPLKAPIGLRIGALPPTPTMLVSQRHQWKEPIS